MKRRFTVEAGRQIYREGVPFISIHREGETSPCEADEIMRIIAALLNIPVRVKKTALARNTSAKWRRA
jgi:hypothetical protein